MSRTVLGLAFLAMVAVGCGYPVASSPVLLLRTCVEKGLQEARQAGDTQATDVVCDLRQDVAAVALSGPSVPESALTSFGFPAPVVRSLRGSTISGARLCVVMESGESGQTTCTESPATVDQVLVARGAVIVVQFDTVQGRPRLLGMRLAEQPGAGPRDIRLNDGRVLAAVDVYVTRDGELDVEYRSSHALTDCVDFQEEVRALWESFVKAEADRVATRRVQIRPLDATGSGQIFAYRRAAAADDAWQEQGFVPCGRLTGDFLESTMSSWRERLWHVVGQLSAEQPLERLDEFGQVVSYSVPENPWIDIEVGVNDPVTPVSRRHPPLQP